MADTWKEVVDKTSGKTYYYNKATKETSWSKPAGFDGGSGRPATSPAPSTGGGGGGGAVSDKDDPANWKATVDPTSKKTYYYNKKTKETSWSVPACMAKSGAESKSSSKAAGGGKGGEEDEEDGVEDSNFGAAAASKVKVDLAEWKEVSDPKSGKSYWYNKKTKETSWHKPGESKPKKAFSYDDDEPVEMSKKDEVQKSKAEFESPAERLKNLKLNLQDREEAEAKEEEEDGDADFQFAKHRSGWFNRTFRTGDVKDEGELLSFKKSLIKKAILKQNRDLDAEAVQAFKNVMSYMGDRKSSKEPIDHAKKMLGNLMVAPAGLRDEVLMQICKQTTNNPTPASCIKGWELMSFCLACFPPSRTFKGFLKEHLNKAISDASSPKEVKALAKLCQERMDKVIAMGQRKEVPSKLELECLATGKPVPIKVGLYDDSFKTFNVDPYTTVQEVEAMMVEKVELDFVMPFSLYEAGDPNVERLIDQKARVLDVVASWERPSNMNIEVKKEKVEVNKRRLRHKDEGKHIKPEGAADYYELIFKARLALKTNDPDVMNDKQSVHLLYLQAVHDVVTFRYPVVEKEIEVLAALQLQATYGDYQRDVHVQGWLTPKIEEVMPSHLLRDLKTDALIDQKVQEWQQKILSKYAKVNGFSTMEAKLNYLDYVQEWPFYGAAFFRVEQRQFKDYPGLLQMAITCEGVILMHPEKKSVLENWPYSDIVTWGHSDEKFILVVGNVIQQRKLIFKASDGEQMNRMIHDYVKFKVKTTK